MRKSANSKTHNSQRVAECQESLPTSHWSATKSTTIVLDSTPAVVHISCFCHGPDDPHQANHIPPTAKPRRLRPSRLWCPSIVIRRCPPYDIDNALGSSLWCEPSLDGMNSIDCARRSNKLLHRHTTNGMAYPARVEACPRHAITLVVTITCGKRPITM